MHYLTNLLNLSGQRKSTGHQQDVAELKVKTAQGVVLEDQLPSIHDLTLTADAPHPLGGKTQVLEQPQEIDVVGHRSSAWGQGYRSSTLVNPEVKSAIADLVALAPAHNPANLEGIGD